MKRKVVQITDFDDTIVALCNDGSIWILRAVSPEASNLFECEWVQMEDVPQGDDA